MPCLKGGRGLGDRASSSDDLADEVKRRGRLGGASLADRSLEASRGFGPIDPAPGPVEAIVWSEPARRVEEALGKFPPSLRKVVVHRGGAGHPAVAGMGLREGDQVAVPAEAIAILGLPDASRAELRPESSLSPHHSGGRGFARIAGGIPRG